MVCFYKHRLHACTLASSALFSAFGRNSTEDMVHLTHEYYIVYLYSDDDVPSRPLVRVARSYPITAADLTSILWGKLIRMNPTMYQVLSSDSDVRTAS